MLTRTGRLLVNGQRNSDIIFQVPDSSNAKGCINAINCLGNNVIISCTSLTSTLALIRSASFTATGSSASYGVAVGTGDTTPTENDYNLASYINTLKTSASPAVNYSFDTTTGVYTSYVDYTLSNETAEDITVKEIGKFIRGMRTSAIGAAVNPTQSDYVSIMVDRTVLETPLTVPAGGSAILRYSFSYQYDAAST